MTSLRTLALEAIATGQWRDHCPEPDYNNAIIAAFDAKQNFLSALRVATGIDDALWRELGGSILP